LARCRDERGAASWRDGDVGFVSRKLADVDVFEEGDSCEVCNGSDGGVGACGGIENERDVTYDVAGGVGDDSAGVDDVVLVCRKYPSGRHDDGRVDMVQGHEVDTLRDDVHAGIVNDSVLEIGGTDKFSVKVGDKTAGINKVGVAVIVYINKRGFADNGDDLFCLVFGGG